MQLSQVLNEDQRRERFASSLQRKRALNAGEDDDSDDEFGVDPMTADSLHNTFVQDSSLSQPEEAEVLVVPKVEPNLLLQSSSSMSLDNLPSTGSVPRHLRGPPPLIPNNSLGFQFTLPPFNLQSALIQQLQDQYNLARWQSQNPMSTVTASYSNAMTQNISTQNSVIQKGFTQNGLNQNGLISFPSTSNQLHRPRNPTFAQDNRARSTKSSSSYWPTLGSLRGPCSTFPPPSCSSLSVLEVSPRISVIQNSKRPREDQVNGRLTHSNTKYEDLTETEDTFDFVTAATTSTTTTTTTCATSTSSFGYETSSQEHPLNNSSLHGAGNFKF